MADDKEPRWDSAPAPGFTASGESLIVPDGQEIKWPEAKVKIGDKTMTIAEYEAMLADEAADDE